MAGASISPLSRRVSTSPWLALAIGLVLLLIAVPTADLSEPPGLVIQFACCVLGGVAVLRPVLAGTLIGVALAFMLLLGMSFLGMAVLALPIAIGISAIRGHRFPALLFAIWYVGVSTILTARSARNATELARGVDFWLVFMFAPLLLGELIRRLQQRAEGQRRAQAQETERQRRAIARDLHDTLAYATTTMVMKAEQARLRGGLDDQTLSDLDFIATTGRSAAADLRTMVALLRESDTSTDDAPDTAADAIESAPGALPLSRLEEVIDAQRAKLMAFDFEVNLSVSGEPSALPDRVSTVVARVLTEVASNITKHGDPCAEITIMIDVDDPEIEAVFVNAIRTESTDRGQPGLGMIGLREIVAAEGGTIESSKLGERWVTHLTMPREGGGRA